MAQNEKAKKGNSVTVNYEGRFESGEVFDTSKHEGHEHPLTFTIGERQVIKGFENAVEGMKIGEEKTVFINPEEGYGVSNPELKKEVPKSALPAGQEPKAGMTIMAQTPDGRSFPVPIAEVNEKTFIIDLNHPLAGKKLIFKIKLEKIN